MIKRSNIPLNKIISIPVPNINPNHQFIHNINLNNQANQTQNLQVNQNQIQPS